MRAGARLGWRVAVAVAFAATATLAVTVSRSGPMTAALASAKEPGAQHAAATRAPRHAVATLRCAASGLRISVGPGARVTTAITRYPLDFTNVSDAPCTLSGYPQVAAYWGDGGQVGDAAGHDTSIAARRILLAPGQTAHASLDAAMPAARCRPVRAAGLRVTPPGQSAARYVKRPLTTCTVQAPRGQHYLRVRAIQPGAGTPAPKPAPPRPSLRPRAQAGTAPHSRTRIAEPE
jgi:hypothetical protein